MTENAGMGGTPMLRNLHRRSYTVRQNYDFMQFTLAFAVGYYLLLSVCSFAVYAYDKGQAKRTRWRVRESTLHAIDWLGGWPGGWLARRWLRHKSSKQSFRRVFAWTVAVHVLLWIGAAWAVWTTYRT